MASVIYPDLAGALMPALQLRQQRENNALMLDRQSRLDAQNAEDRLEDRGLRREEMEARREDRKAARDDRHLARISQLDEAQRKKLADFSTFQAHGGMAVLSSPPEQQPQAYALMRQQAQSRGYDMSLFPEQWDASTAARLKFAVDQAQPYADYFKNQADKPTPMTGGPTGAPATVAPDATAKGQQFVSRLTQQHGFSPVAAGGIVGGLYQESGFDPGYGFTRPGGDNGTAHGLAQWRLDRADGLKKFAATQGKPPTDENVQLDYLVSEMKGGDMGAQRAYALLQQAKTPEEASTAMMHFFRPQGYTPSNPQGGHGYQQRVQYAQRFMPNAEQAVLRGPPGQPEPIGTYTPGTAQVVPAGGPQVAQAPGGPASSIPGVPQGGGDANGNPAQPEKMIEPHESVTDDLAALVRSGYVRAGKNGVQLKGPTGGYLYMDPRSGNSIEYKPKDTDTVAGPFGGKSVQGQSLNMLISQGVLSQRQAAELGAGKVIQLSDGSTMFFGPQGLVTQPGQGGAPGGAAPAPTTAPAPGQPTVAPPPAATPPGAVQLGAPKAVQPPEWQAKAAGFAGRMASANTLLDELAVQGTSSKGRFLESLGSVGNYAQSPEYQRFEQAKRNFVNAQLRDESGAAIGASEFMSADKQYFPQPGQETNKELLAQMAENRRQVVEAMMVKAGILKMGQRYEPPARAPAQGDGNTSQGNPSGPPGGSFIGNTPDGRPIFLMQDGSKVVPQ